MCNFAGEGINKLYFPIFIPIGILGNFLAFMVRLFKLTSCTDTFV